MSFLFSRSKQKVPQDLVKTLSECLFKLETNAIDRKKTLDETSRTILQIKYLLCGDQENEPVAEQITAISQDIASSEILIPLISSLYSLEFDSRKDVIVIFTSLLRHQTDTKRNPCVEYLAKRPKFFDTLIINNQNQDIALTIGAIIRDCIKHEALAKIVLSSPLFWNYFDYVNKSSFEIATDAFSTISDILTTHQELAAEFLYDHKEIFTSKMSTLMASDNYVTKRQSLKLMAHTIRQRSNYQYMTFYISDPDNLKQVMILLRDKSRNIQYEVFHIFKIFVANPKKSKPILDILTKNKSKLLAFLSNFTSDRKEDESFNDERAFVIKQISALQSSSLPTTPDSHSSSQSRSPSPSRGIPHPSTNSGSSILTPAPSLPPPVVHSVPVLRGEHIH